ncbi:MAG: hypothetical protein IT535_08540 [Bauldia sp.]|nr:hypothetical protein [Bauldia sp.]
MNKKIAIALASVAALTVLGFGPAQAQAPAETGDPSFFITSVGLGDGANLGGIEGADAHCQSLAAAAGWGGATWRAYLSTQGEGAVNARDRIGSGPWYNAAGALVAADVAALHTEPNNINKELALNELGNLVNGRGDTPNEHDILTGSQQDGTAFAAGEDMTCSNWTSNGEGSAMMGHHDLQGNPAGINFWNFSHGSRGCSQENLVGTGGAGLFYCFAE